MNKMQVLHKFDDDEILRDSENDVSILISNKNLGYTYLSERPKSRYEGVFFQINGRPCRVIADIGFRKKIRRIVNKFHSFERTYKDNVENFFMPYNYNSLVYELEKEKWFNLSLDIRHIYRIPKFGRFYNIWEENGNLIIKYTQENEYDAFLVVRGDDLKYKKTERWLKVSYINDKKRNSKPYELYIYSALRLKSKCVVMSFGEDKNSALNEANYIYENLERIRDKQKRYTKNLMGEIDFGSNEINFAYRCCLNSLNQLATDDGLIAGLPWFFQYWTRDEAISINGFDNDFKKKILLRDLDNLKEDGRISNILNDNNSGNADSIGWVFKRISDSLDIFGVKEKNDIRKKLLQSIGRLNNRYARNGLIFNEKNETWMDTSFNDDGRLGARIEIQALSLNMFKLAYRLTKNEKFLELESMLREVVREKFWNGKFLADGFNDFTIRPNVFIAAYVYPELLTKSEWIKCFENILPRLWCNWGGLTTIDKKNPLFTEKYTGEFPKSYHRGDSWFFLNNMAALILYRTNRIKFKRYIKKIIKASTTDILWKGAIGHHSELSSAFRQKSQGCKTQAWSNALYLELINEIYSKR